MNLIALKTASESGIKGLELVKQNGQVCGAILRQDGKEIHFTSSYGMTISQRQDHTEEKRFAVAGEIAGLKATELFNDEYTALDRKRELVNAGGTAEMKEVAVKVAEDGKVVDDIPF
jgi:hypothetical protein